MSTKIEWCRNEDGSPGETLNPQGWGCFGPGGAPDNPQPCSYCYAKRMASRMMRTCELCNQFVPHYHPEVMEMPYRWKKPRKIFWQSMGDLFHPHTPDWLIQGVFAVVGANSRHTHIFLTKNPKRLKEFNPWPSNCWVGTTVTNQADADERLPWLLQVDAPVRFVSVEPLLGPVDIENWLYPGGRAGRKCVGCGLSFGHDSQVNIGLPAIACSSRLNWGIIGGMTGPGAVEVKNQWVENLIAQYRSAGVPCFVKDNLRRPKKIQEWP